MTLLPEAIATGSIGDFAVIPVLDLKDGLVVHARAGKQARAGKRAEEVRQAVRLLKSGHRYLPCRRSRWHRGWVPPMWYRRR